MELERVKMIDLTKPYEVKRIRKDDQGRYLLSKGYEKELARMIKLDASQYKSYKPFRKAHTDFAHIKVLYIYGYLLNGRFYVWLCDQESMRELVNSQPREFSKHVQLMANQNSCALTAIGTSWADNETVHPKIDDIVESIENGIDPFEPNHPLERYNYCILDKDDMEFIVNEIDTREHAQKFVEDETYGRKHLFIDHVSLETYDPVDDVYYTKEEHAYRGKYDYHWKRA